MSFRLGVLADSPHIRYAINAAVADLDFEIVSYSLESNRTVVAGKGSEDSVDIWVVVPSDLAAEQLAEVDQLSVQVLILERVPSVANVQFVEWKQRVGQKLMASAKRAALQKQPKEARYLWLLAASTGGLEAVVRFLQHVPNVLPDVGFVYAQHIEPEQAQHLADAIERVTQWQAAVIDDNHCAEAGMVSIVSPAYKTEMQKQGRFSVKRALWTGLHKPSIDHLAADLSRHYGSNAGMIVFTGMGDDGTKGSFFISRQGGQVWVQSPESCVARSMPESVLKKGRSHSLANIPLLAEKFNHYYLRRVAV